MATASYGTITTNGYAFSLPTTEESAPDGTPSGLLVTRAQEVKSGWRGQVLVDKTIVFESKAQKTADEAIKIANAKVVAVIAGLFA